LNLTFAPGSARLQLIDGSTASLSRQGVFLLAGSLPCYPSYLHLGGRRFSSFWNWNSVVGGWPRKRSQSAPRRSSLCLQTAIEQRLTAGRKKRIVSQALAADIGSGRPAVLRMLSAPTSFLPSACTDCSQRGPSRTKLRSHVGCRRRRHPVEPHRRLVYIAAQAPVRKCRTALRNPEVNQP
jgi:hypothetical protein